MTALVGELLSAVSDAVLPDGVVLTLTQWIHDFEEWSLPMPSPSTVMWGTILGLPLAVAAHDSSNKWLSQKYHIPVVSWFQRRWKKSESAKHRDLFQMKDAVVFLYVAASLYEGNMRVVPLDYIADRLVNATSRTILTREMQSKRNATYVAAQGMLNAGAFDADKTAALRETAIRRRMVQENVNL